MRKDDKKTERILFILIYPLVVWAALKVAPFYNGGIFCIIENLIMECNDPFHFIWCSESIKSIALFTLIYELSIAVYLSSKKNYRRQEEHGSAKWGDVKGVCRKYGNRKYEKNKLLSEGVRINLNGRKHMRNLNTLVVGGSGSGKTRFYAKPNLMQANTSFVVLDPKGEMLRSCGNLLIDEGYELKVLDLLHMDKSFCYNPFAYIEEDNDIMRLVTNLVKNTTPKNSVNNDPFWEKSEIALLEALMFYLYYEAPEYEQNFAMVMDMLGASEAKEENDEFDSIIDVIFARLKARDPEHIASRQYEVFKKAAGKTAKSILVSLAVRLEKFNLDSLRSITNTDEMELDTMGDKKCALFCVIPDNDSSFNFIVGMLYTQLFQMLYKRADSLPDGRLPVHVHFLMDEFSNVALPNEFDKILSTMRSREISVSIIIQNMAQLKALFDKQWESIVGNCDELVYLGGNEQSTHKYISELLGKETIDTNTYGLTKGRNGHYSVNMQQSGRELLTPDEVRMIDNRYALIFIRGERPLMDLKYNILSHPNIKRTSDGGATLYEHGMTYSYELDINDITLVAGGDYELFDEADLEQHLKEEKENKKNEK